MRFLKAYFKGYLRYKKITFQNGASEAQVKNSFFPVKVMFHSQYTWVFVLLTTPWFSKSVMSWRVLVHETVHFWIHLLNHNSLSHQTWPIDRYKQGQQLSGIFWTIWWTGAMFQVLFNLATCYNYSITNYVKIPVFHFVEKVNKGESKMVNVNY